MSLPKDQDSVEARHSSRTERTHRSANALAVGARTGVRMIVTFSEVNTVSSVAGNVLSRSWIRNRAGSVASWICQLRWRAWCVAQAPVGLVVQPASWTHRLPTSMKNRISSVFNHAVSTVKKSQASTSSLWCARNVRQLLSCLPRSGAGGTHRRLSTSRRMCQDSVLESRRQDCRPSIVEIEADCSMPSRRSCIRCESSCDTSAEN